MSNPMVFPYRRLVVTGTTGMGKSTLAANLSRRLGPDFAELEEGLHPRAVEGFRCFNAGTFFEAHEALEDAWRETSAPLRGLYRGVLQAAVVYLHLQRGNLRGALKVYRRSRKWLEPWPEEVAGVEVGQLRRDLARVMEAAACGGRLAAGNFPPLRWKEERRT